MSIAQNKELARARMLWEDALTRVMEGREYVLTDERAHALAVALDDIETRDQVLLFIIDEQATAIDVAYGEFNARMASALERKPNEERIERAVGLLARIADIETDCASVDAIAGYAMWHSGQLVPAMFFISAALERDVDYSLAVLVGHAIAVSLPSPWQV